MRKTTSKRLICCALSLLTFASTLPGAVFAAEEAEEAPQKSTLQEISESLVSYSYADYREDHADAGRGRAERVSAHQPHDPFRQTGKHQKTFCPPGLF